jgi:hypothetical protein
LAEKAKELKGSTKAKEQKRGEELERLNEALASKDPNVRNKALNHIDRIFSERTGAPRGRGFKGVEVVKVVGALAVVAVTFYWLDELIPPTKKDNPGPATIGGSGT